MDHPICVPCMAHIHGGYLQLIYADTCVRYNVYTCLWVHLSATHIYEYLNTDGPYMIKKRSHCTGLGAQGAGGLRGAASKGELDFLKGCHLFLTGGL